jgi:hypothetical protein
MILGNSCSLGSIGLLGEGLAPAPFEDSANINSQTACEFKWSPSRPLSPGIIARISQRHALDFKWMFSSSLRGTTIKGTVNPEQNCQNVVAFNRPYLNIWVFY